MPYVVVHDYNPSTWKAEVEGLLCVQEYPELHRPYFPPCPKKTLPATYNT